MTTAKEAGVENGVVFSIDDEDFARELARRIGETKEAVYPSFHPCYVPKQSCTSEPEERIKPAFLPQDLLNKKIFISVAEENRKRGLLSQFLSLFSKGTSQQGRPL
jgi:hypothetical protein